MDLDTGASIHETRQVFVDAGFPATEILPPTEGHYFTAQQVENFLATHLPTDGQSVNFGLGYFRSGNIPGHILNLRTWLDNGAGATNNRLRLLTIDFQVDPFRADRFGTRLPPDGTKFWLYYPRQ